MALLPKGGGDGDSVPRRCRDARDRGTRPNVLAYLADLICRSCRCHLAAGTGASADAPRTERCPMTRSYSVVVREESGFQYAVSVTASSAEEAKRKLQADLDEWGEADEVLMVLALHPLDDSR